MLVNFSYIRKQREMLDSENWQIERKIQSKKKCTKSSSIVVWVEFLVFVVWMTGNRMRDIKLYDNPNKPKRDNNSCARMRQLACIEEKTNKSPLIERKQGRIKAKRIKAERKNTHKKECWFFFWFLFFCIFSFYSFTKMFEVSFAQ